MDLQPAGRVQLAPEGRQRGRLDLRGHRHKRYDRPARIPTGRGAAGRTGTGVTGTGTCVTGAGTGLTGTGTGLTGAGTGVKGAGVKGAGVTGAGTGVSGAGTHPGRLGFTVVPAAETVGAVRREHLYPVPPAVAYRDRRTRADVVGHTAAAVHPAIAIVVGPSPDAQFVAGTLVVVGRRAPVRLADHKSEFC